MPSMSRIAEELRSQPGVLSIRFRNPHASSLRFLDLVWAGGALSGEHGTHTNSRLESNKEEEERSPRRRRPGHGHPSSFSLLLSGLELSDTKVYAP